MSWIEWMMLRIAGTVELSTMIGLDGFSTGRLSEGLEFLLRWCCDDGVSIWSSLTSDSLSLAPLRFFGGFDFDVDFEIGFGFGFLLAVARDSLRFRNTRLWPFILRVF